MQKIENKMKLKVLNLYAGIGGNRKLWTDVDVTAVEYDEKIAAIYKDFFPEDNVIVADAHQFLLDHFREYDFIWASPPCPTHSRLVTANVPQGMKLKYPDMALYQEIIILDKFFKGKYCVENVITYYDPLIKPLESNSHYFWANFKFKRLPNQKRGIERNGKASYQNKEREKITGFDLSKFNLSRQFERKLLNNCVEPEIALHILNCARGIIEHKPNQLSFL